MKVHAFLAEHLQAASTLQHSPEKTLRGLIFTKSTIGFPSYAALSPQLASQQGLLLAGSWGASGQKFASGHISLEALLSRLRPQSTLLRATCAHVEVLLSPELFLLYVWLVCVSVFFFNLCFPSLKCWDLGGVSFRKPSLANVHDHCLLLLLTHCLHFLPLGICLLCARLGPGRGACWQNLLMGNMHSDGEVAFWHSWSSLCGSPALPETQRCLVHET